MTCMLSLQYVDIVDIAVCATFIMDSSPLHSYTVQLKHVIKKK